MAEQKPAAAEEWLPPGWTVEIRVRKNGKKDRVTFGSASDFNPNFLRIATLKLLCFFWGGEYYINPSNGSKFDSKPEVLRYLKSLESIHPESEGKRRSRRSRSALDSPAAAERINLADSETNGNEINNQSSKPVGKLKNEQGLESCAGGEEISIRCSELTETMDLDQKEKNEPVNGGSDLANVPEASSQQMPEVEKIGHKRLLIGNDRSKNSNKKPDLPRRTSKRLAGVEVGPIPELNSNSRGRRVSTRRVDETDSRPAMNLLDETKATATEDNKETSDRKHDCLMPPESSMRKEHDFPVETNDNRSEVAGPSLDVPLKDLWLDPCIEFAIKTLTGAIPIEEELEKKGPPEVPEPSNEKSPFGDLWSDPCIEFAVKTLTGDIPVDDPSIQDLFHKGDKNSEFGLGLGNVSNSGASLTSGLSQKGNASL